MRQIREIKPRGGRPPRESLEQARRRKESALADLREMEAARRRGELVEAEKVRLRWASALAGIRDRILSVPDRIAAQLAGRDEYTIRSLLREELEQALRSAHGDARPVNNDE